MKILSITHEDNLCRLGEDPRHYWVMEAARLRGCSNRDIGLPVYSFFDGQGINSSYFHPLDLYNKTVDWLVNTYPKEFKLEQ